MNNQMQLNEQFYAFWNFELLLSKFGLLDGEKGGTPTIHAVDDFMERFYYE
jgi:hypothetical protein